MQKGIYSKRDPDFKAIPPALGGHDLEQNKGGVSDSDDNGGGSCVSIQRLWVKKYQELREKQYPKGEHGDILRLIDTLWKTSFHFPMTKHDRLTEIVDEYFKKFT